VIASHDQIVCAAYVPHSNDGVFSTAGNPGTGGIYGHGGDDRHDQGEHPAAHRRRPNVIIQVVRDTGYFFGLEGQFMIASGREIPDTLNIVTVEDQTTTEPAMVDRVAALFERIRGHALTIEESRVIIQEALQRWNSQRQAPAGARPATATAAPTPA
jgi:hypothetical protein